MEEKRSLPSEKPESGLPTVLPIAGGPVSLTRTPFSPPPAKSFVSKLWPGRWVLLTAILGCTLLALIPGSIQAPLYKIQTSIDLQNQASFYPRQKAASDGFAPQPEYIETQTRIIQSRSLVERILVKLSEAERSRIVVSPRLTWKRPSYAESVGSILQRLSVHASPQAGIVDICFLSPDSEAGAHFLNLLTEELADYNLERSWRAAQRNRVWTERQLEDLRSRWEHAEQAVLEYSQSSGITRQPRASHLRPEGRVSTTQASPLRSPEATDLKLRQLKSHLADLNKRIADWQSLYGASAPALAALKSQAAAAEIAIRQRRAALNLTAGPEDASRRTTIASSSPQAIAHLNVLENDAESNRQIYEANATRLRETSISDTSHISDISVVDPAIAVTRPDTPRQARNAFIGALSGLMMGLFAIGFRERFSQTFSEATVLSQYLQLDVLGTVPQDRFEQENGFVRATEKLSLNLSFDKDARTAEAYRALRSSILIRADQLRANQVRAGDTGGPTRLVFASADQSEGKTYVVGNLGAALASAHRKVLLVDGNLRKPALHELFGSTNEHGLSDLLTRQLSDDPVKMSDVIRQTQVPGLYLLTAGKASTQAPEILSSVQLPQLLQEVGKGFDFVLIDSPPVLPFADARSLAHAADSVVLIIRANSTSRREALLAREAISQDNSAIAGAILTSRDAR